MITQMILKKAVALTKKRDPDLLIGPSRDDPYLLRWYWIPRNRFFNIYVHVFLKDDDDRALHDHPWKSLSLTCRGSIVEHYKETPLSRPKRRTIATGQWTKRSATLAHRLSIPPQKNSPITVFITGRRTREWGYHCPKGWRHWEDFVKKDETGSVGQGCR